MLIYRTRVHPHAARRCIDQKLFVVEYERLQDLIDVLLQRKSVESETAIESDSTLFTRENPYLTFQDILKHSHGRLVGGERED